MAAEESRGVLLPKLEIVAEHGGLDQQSDNDIRRPRFRLASQERARTESTTFVQKFAARQRCYKSSRIE